MYSVKRAVIYLLLIFTFYLGIPVMHYAVALFISALIRHKDLGLFDKI